MVWHDRDAQTEDASGIRVAAEDCDLPTFADARLSQMQPVDVREWVSKLVTRGLSASRIRQAYHLFGAIMRSAVESGYIARSTCVGVKLPRMTQREMLLLSAEQVGRSRDGIGQHLEERVHRMLSSSLPQMAARCAIRHGIHASGRRRFRAAGLPHLHVAWRRAWDSNPQVLSDNGFQDRPLAN
jgi:hypothetical protein